MKLEAGRADFDGLPQEFTSFFPSTDATYSERYNALISKLDDIGGKNFAEAYGAQQQAKTWRNANALMTASSAQQGLSILADMLPQVSWVKGQGQAAIKQGLWAPVSFGLTANPDELGTALAEAGLNIALKAVQAVPIYGQVIQAVIGIGRLFYGLFSRPAPEEPPLVLPWSKYSKGLDEDLVRELISFNAGVNLTAAFMPPATPHAWLLGEGISEGEPVDGGQVWSPALQSGGLPDWTGGFGCMPGTMRVAGIVQRVLWRTTANPRLSRFFRDYYSAEIPWGSATTDTGDYFPALAQAGACLWQQVQKAGTPQMYMVEAGKVKQAWIDWFEFMFQSAWARYSVDPSVGELLAPYIAVYRQHPGSDKPSWRLGIQNLERPMPAPFVTPAIFKNGPATVDTRTRCLFIERKVHHETGAWPWRRSSGLPEAHPDINYRSFAYNDAKGLITVDEASRWFSVKAHPTACNLPPNEKCPDSEIPEGYVCVPWPTGDELLSGYARPDEAIIGPACDRLRQLQLRCLESTTVCAVVRPFDGSKGPLFAAFKDKALQDKCKEMRELLLQHPARFRVLLKDVDPIDPEFGLKLRDSGVKNTPEQLAGKGLSAGGDTGMGGGGEEPLPDPIPPSRGVAFDNLPPQRWSLLWGPN